MLAANSREHVDCVSRVVRNADRLSQAPVPSLIFDSWRRSMEQHHLDPGSLQGPRILSEPLLKECRERAELFMRIAGEAVGQLHHRVRHADYCVMLTDAQGQTIDHRVDTAIRTDCRKAGLYLGKNICHRKRMGDIRLAAAAALAVVGLFGVEIRSADQVDLVWAEVGR